MLKGEEGRVDIVRFPGIVVPVRSRIGRGDEDRNVAFLQNMEGVEPLHAVDRNLSGH